MALEQQFRVVLYRKLYRFLMLRGTEWAPVKVIHRDGKSIQKKYYNIITTAAYQCLTICSKIFTAFYSHTGAGTCFTFLLQSSSLVIVSTLRVAFIRSKVRGYPWPCAPKATFKCMIGDRRKETHMQYRDDYPLSLLKWFSKCLFADILKIKYLFAHLKDFRTQLIKNKVTISKI